MAMANVSASSSISSPLLPSSSSKIPIASFPTSSIPLARKRRALLFPSFALENLENRINCELPSCKKEELFCFPILPSRTGINCEAHVMDRSAEEEEEEEEEEEGVEPIETTLYSFTPLPLLFVAALPGAGTVKSLFGPFVELVKSFNLPDWLVHWGHPGNMAVVLLAMGGYGTYLGFRIRFSDDIEEKAKAKDLHPKLLAGMFFFFALGATGGVTSLLTSDKPIFESPHAVTGSIGLALLTIQTILPTLFEGNPGLRNVHGILGSGIMTLFLVHAALGLQLGLSY